MFAKACHGVLSSRIVAASFKRDRFLLSFKRCFSNGPTCHPLASQGSATALVPHCAQWTAKRFRTKVAESSGSDEIPKLLGSARTQRRRNKAKQPEKGYPIVAFSTAEEYNLECLKEGIAKQQLYSVVEEEEEGFKVQESDHQEDVVHIKARYNVDDEPREVFFFREGTAVFWNVSDLEVSNFLRFISPFEVRRYDEKLVLSEREYMSYIHGESKKTLLRNDIIELSALPESSLEKYSFSNGVALSVKLGIWESSLERFIDSIEFISEDLKAGRKIRMTREEVLRKQGELFAMRHSINLSSDLLDTPDFYWDNEELERLFLQTINYYCISRRTRVMNEKISHCAEMMELVSSHLSDKHHIRLEWMIIVLIMVEVGFEFLHFMK
ncbi:required for meiotic nuclear division protein 1 homolog [Thrips palmi]|uniref:Required for meiotic nuclear division protein 1 homolog n=1 Tax=Thrips palmi TaxID=161013 RepID=A0A6P8ZYS5_THRPL|nr:required for meiotic nuclear division protein 1 homolog [Thrips palmi]